MTEKEAKEIIKKIEEYLDNAEISNDHCISIISSKDIIDNTVISFTGISILPECVITTKVLLSFIPYILNIESFFPSLITLVPALYLADLSKPVILYLLILPLLVTTTIYSASGNITDNPDILSLVFIAKTP